MNSLLSVQDAVVGLLTEVAMHFKGRPKITLLVRHPDLEADGKDADFVMTDDTLANAIVALQRRSALSTPPAIEGHDSDCGLLYEDGPDECTCRPPASEAATGDGLREALEAQMEDQDENLPSSIARDRGLVWLAGWFDLPAALANKGVTDNG